MATTAAKSVSVTLTLNKPGKSASRYSTTDAGAPATNVYFTADYLASVGNPETLTMTVAPA